MFPEKLQEKERRKPGDQMEIFSGQQKSKKFFSKIETPD